MKKKANPKDITNESKHGQPDRPIIKSGKVKKKGK
jgi:hypothetical protein